MTHLRAAALGEVTYRRIHSVKETVITIVELKLKQLKHFETLSLRFMFNGFLHCARTYDSKVWEQEERSMLGQAMLNTLKPDGSNSA